ncbi:peptidase domain-containing ABC transporter [Hymenobacter sp.]|jgi:ATP-binding cassette subfamily B protein|uniref:peptidase domain-containing ABC transporter n=1 Tax=Hymenobacter sp. TaxID=1898978 RepID=UPI002ED99BE6
MPKLKFIPQFDQMDCGPACLAMVSSYYGKAYSLQFLREKSYVTKDGVSILGIRDAAGAIGFDTIAVKLSVEDVAASDNLPCILHWNQNHFVVLHGVLAAKNGRRQFLIADPAFGRLKLTAEAFEKAWLSESSKGVAVLLTPEQRFYSQAVPKQEGVRLKHMLAYITPYKKNILQLFLSLLAGSFITLLFPFLTKSLIDRGVNNRSLHIVFIILLAQISLHLGSVIIDIVRNWVTLYVGARVNIAIVSDFFKKILKLPIRFFDTKLVGDFNQRIQDQDRIERFLTSHSLITIFSVINFLAFFVVLLYYNSTILLVYILLTTVAIAWSIFFMKQRKILDIQRFQNRAESQGAIFEIVNGIQEIKLNNYETYKRQTWEQIQIKLFGVNLNVLRVDQLQLMGFDFINQIKNILVAYIAARQVIIGNLTLGSMLSITYIIGQMNSPVTQLISFFRSLQDAKLSLERLNDMQVQQEEEQPHQVAFTPSSPDSDTTTKKGIDIRNLSFQYEGPRSPYTLKNINLFIPEGKTTAIVGESGSGKTTLMKILLKFYEPTSGYIMVGEHGLHELSASSWRNNCGAVMQDGFIFSDTIERNIITSDAVADDSRFNQAVAAANIKDFLVSLPLRENTKIGSAGTGISGGQKQRLLIARAVYKAPHYIFFDEATSSLDANNESIIHHNLQEFFVNKTVVIIAHRLSTVKNADQIVVLKDGMVIEQGNHSELVALKGSYFSLVKNQLELSV